MSERKHSHVYGPVPSRRLGRSLGVDLVPFKVCPFDCTYCQVGRTTIHTDRRDAYLDADEILAELREVLGAGIEADYITLSGSGEPTLCSRLDELIERIKAMTDVPVAVLTNILRVTITSFAYYIDKPQFGQKFAFAVGASNTVSVLGVWPLICNPRAGYA